MIYLKVAKRVDPKIPHQKEKISFFFYLHKMIDVN